MPKIEDCTHLEDLGQSFLLSCDHMQSKLSMDGQHSQCPHRPTICPLKTMNWEFGIMSCGVAEEVTKNILPFDLQWLLRYMHTTLHIAKP